MQVATRQATAVRIVRNLILLALFLATLSMYSPTAHGDQIQRPGWLRDALVSISAAGFDFFNIEDDVGRTLNEKLILELGVGARVSRRISPGLEVGLGVNYDFANGSKTDGHFFVLPISFTMAFGEQPFGAEVIVGLQYGPAFCILDRQEHRNLYGRGHHIELFGGYSRPLTNERSLFTQLGLRVDYLDIRNRQLDRRISDGVNIQLGVRVGMRWR